MSNRRFVSTRGVPYLAFACNVGGSDVVPSLGFFDVILSFRVESLPEQSASADEIHPLFAFVQDSAARPDIFAVGITPSGRVAAKVKTGAVWQTGISRVLDATAWHTLEVGYDGASGAFITTFDGNVDNTVIDPFPEYLVPDAGQTSRLMLFNGGDGLTKMAASVSEAKAFFFGAARNTTLTWDFARRAGGTIPVALTTSDGGTTEFTTSLDLVAERWAPPFSSPWGAVPMTSTNGEYTRGLQTDWTRRAKPTTVWTRVAA